VPISISSEWNIITRTILPVIWNPSLGPGIPGKDGTGDTVFTAFLSPAKPGEWIWGAGSGGASTDQFERPARQQELGNRSVVRHAASCAWRSLGLRVPHQQHLVRDEQQDRRFVQQRAHPAVRQLQLRGRAVPHELADPHRRVEGGQRQSLDRADRRWRGQDLSLGKLPVNSQLSAYYNVVRPDFGANWQIRAQIQLMFPK
jgi:hypothetical protein